MSIDVIDESFFGSEYISPEEAVGVNERAVDFKLAVEQAKLVEPYIVPFDAIASQAEVDYGTSINEVCADQVLGIAAENGSRFFTNSQEMADILSWIHSVGISRTSIAETSAHKVFFASVVNEQPYRVAVKSFLPYGKSGFREKAVNEWVNILLARRIGLDTFSPMAFLLTDASGYVITMRQDDLDPMDNTDWSTVLDYPQKENMITDLRKIGPSLARLHDKGCYHGDPQVKNVVLTQTGSVHLIDWEAATFVDPRKGIDPAVYKKTVRDLIVLFGSLARETKDKGVGLLARQTPVTQRHFFDELVLKPYIEERMKLAEGRPQTEQDALLDHLVEIDTRLAEYIQN